MMDKEVRVAGSQDAVTEDLDQNSPEKEVQVLDNQDAVSDSSDTEKETRPSSAEKPTGIVTEPKAEAQEHEFLTGVKLLLVLSSVTLVVFLMMLDIAIVATVSFVN
jgi:hypothetical protein